MLGPQSHTGRLVFVLGFLLGTSLSLATASSADRSYGYLRTVDGPADLVHCTSQTSVEATANYPIQVGDQLRVSPRGRLEAVLPDGSLARLGANTELRLGRLAGARDTLDDANLLHLVQGQLHLDLQVAPPRVDGFRLDTANSTIYLLQSGTYRIFTDGSSWTQILVRSGLAEVVTEDTSTQVGSGQQVLVDGEGSPRILVEAAAPVDGLELWGDRLVTEAREPIRRGYVPPSLAYAAAPLFRHGTWVKHGRRDVWRPHVSADWRPYHSGWWIYTPSGLTWISTEPWGWVTYHYGVWGHAPGVGWFWRPGNTFTPGSVYWQWGPSYVGWVPAGPYSPYYQDPYYALPPFGFYRSFHRFDGLRPVSIWRRSTKWQDWTFCPYDRFGYRNSHQHLISGTELSNRGVLQKELTRAVVTTETRGLTPDLWESPDRLLDRLNQTRSPRVRSTSGLSPLGAAAIGASSQGPTHPVRNWDSATWRRSNLSQPTMVNPYRRDGRFSRSVPYGGALSRVRARGLSGRSWYNSPRVSPSILPRIQRSGIGSRSSSTGAGLTVSGGSRPSVRPSSPGRARTGQPGRMSGSSRVGKPNGGPG